MKNIKLLALLLIGIIWSCGEKPVVVKEVIETEINTEVTAIAIDKNNTKWIGTDKGLYKSVEEGYKLMDISVTGKIYSLFYEESGNMLWISTESALLKATISDDDLSEIEVDNSNLSNPKVNDLHIDNSSKRWFGTELGISLNYGETWKKENFRINTEGDLFEMKIEDFPVNSIASWDGDYFFATSGAKLYRAFDYDESVDAFSGATQWDPPYNGPSITDTMFSVFVDNQGNQWMGGKEGIQVHTGHDAKDPQSFIYIFKDELPDSYVLSITQAANGDIWIGTRKGLAVFNGTAWETITENLPDLYITAIAFDKVAGTWVGTKSGLVSLD
ncbi:MAG: hypothetical protein JXA77_08350 [Bacteroidales bacterium]|nr:hypothetical protein [Bacteroidales bacterium]MBN2820941.1 hypothetical protein [Bacteroidales bacterium]